jgi:prepilin-type N-terminal cleavage/methylation domain-containing protein
MKTATRLRGWTLIELLVVIGIVALLAALLFPVFMTTRGEAREISCVSQLRQIGLAIRMYAQEHDELYPYAVDPTDRYTPQIWDDFPYYQVMIPYMPMLHETLQPYIRSASIFRCPSDTGYDVEDFNGTPLDASPSSFEKFGTSYSYRTEISFRRMGEASFQQPSQVNVLFDAAGKWHGGYLFDRLRYNVLHGDGHVKNLSRSQIDRLWFTPL